MQLARSALFPSTVSSGSGSYVGFLAGLKSAWVSARKTNAAIAELSALDDAQLADMGITRGEIETVVHGH